MRDQVNYYLDRARAAALAGTLGTLTEVEPVIAGLARTFAKIYRDKDLAIELAIPPDLRFRGERQDLEEMAGNLIDNAAKWAAAQGGGGGRDRARGRPAALPPRSSTTTARACRRRRGPRCSSAAAASTRPSPAPASASPSSAISRRSTAAPCRLEASPLGGLRAVLELPGDRS